MTTPVDIFISGGGIAGLVAAAAFGRAGFSVCLADPAPPVDKAEAEGSDLRSTAYLQPARDLLETAGLWDTLAPHATPLDALRVIDTTGWPPEPTATREFRADELGELPFGWNLPNWLTRKVLADHIATLDRVDLRLGVGFKSLLQRETAALITLTDGTRLSAKLAIAADGRASPLREAAGISVTTTRYGQKALAFSVTHPHPHGNISTEIYNAGGAFTLVPLPDHQGGPASAVVWMNDGPRAAELMAMAPPKFEAEMTARSTALLGHLTLASPRRMWPVITQRATRLAAQRVAITAEAAHVLPPIGAQGLNTSLNDIAALLQIATAAPGEIGAGNMLSAYEKNRTRDIKARAAVIDLFNRICRSDTAAIQALRTRGLKAVYDITPVRRAVMQAGLGPG
ncbi:MAG: FAD-dependent monooxygenase [Pseudomonadota bacterium]